MAAWNAIPRALERQIKGLLRQGMGLRQVARRCKCSPSTVARVRDSRLVGRLDHGGPAAFKEVPQYLCVGCSEDAGRDVRVGLEPCPACAARQYRDAQRAEKAALSKRTA